MDFSHDMYALVEKEYGPRMARWGLAIIIAGAISTALLAVGTLGYYTLTRVVRPLVEMLPSVSWSYTSDLVLSVAITIALLAAVGGIAFWRFHVWREVLYLAIQNYTHGLWRRIEHVESSAPSMSSVIERTQHIESRIDRLEIHAGVGDHPATEQEAIARLLGADHGIRKVGRPEDGDKGE